LGGREKSKSKGSSGANVRKRDWVREERSIKGAPRPGRRHSNFHTGGGCNRMRSNKKKRHEKGGSGGSAMPGVRLRKKKEEGEE